MRRMLYILLFILPLSLYSQSQNMRIAILDLQSGTGVPATLALDTSDLIRTEMINLNMFTVIERAQMKEILKEQSLQLSGCTETSCAVEIGQLLSANKILVGKLSQFGDLYTINIRIVDVEKGVGEYAESVDANSLRDIPPQVRILVKKLAGRITGTYFGDTTPIQTPVQTVVMQKPWEALDISQSDYKEMLKYKGSPMGYKQYINAGYDDIDDYIFCLKNNISFEQYLKVKKEKVDPDEYVAVVRLKGSWDEYQNFKTQKYTWVSYMEAVKRGKHTVKDYKIMKLNDEIKDTEKSASTYGGCKVFSWIMSGASTGVAVYGFLTSNSAYDDAAVKYNAYMDSVDTGEMNTLYGEASELVDDGDTGRTVMWVGAGGAAVFSIMALIFRNTQINRIDKAGKLRAELKTFSGIYITPENNMKLSMLEYRW